MAVDFAQGYASSWRVERIDPRTWGPCGRLGGVETIEIDRDGTDDAPLLETASLTVSGAALEQFEPGWFRITMEAVQGGSSEAVPIATVWLESESGRYDKGYREDTLRGLSVLHQAAAEDAVLPDGSFVPKGADGASWCAELLAAHIDAPITVQGGFEMPRSYVFDLGSNVLEAVWQLLKAFGWCMQADGRGEVSILPLPTEPAIALDRTGAATMLPEVSYSDGTRSYTREYAPNVHPFSVVRGMMPERALDGLYRVRTQKLSCTHGVTVQEEVAPL